MSLNNPALHPPRLASSQARTLASRSPSRSPARRHDPLLRDLSPTKTLVAFASKGAETRNDALARSIEGASPAQRALGSRVAQACADLRSWTRELESWQWPGTFDFPEPARKKQRMSNMTILSRTDSDEQKVDEYLGSLPASTVQAHERRVEEICTDFDGVDFEGLKSFILAAHSQAGIREASRSDSIGDIGAATDLKRLDDFTALITATILQALPYMPKLTRLLDTWTTRLSILRSAPKYLRDLKKVRTDLDHGWGALAISQKQSATATLTSENVEDMKHVISTQVYSLGKRLDRFLDMLEGRPEIVPDSWIDDFEDLEQEYGEWVVKAERKVLEGEWRAMKEQVKETALSVARGDERYREPQDLRSLDDMEADQDIQPMQQQQPVAGVTTVFSPTITTQSIVDDDGSYSTSQLISWPAETAPITTTVKTSTSTAPAVDTSTPRESYEVASQGSGSPTRRRHVPIRIDYARPDEPDITDLFNGLDPRFPSNPPKQTETSKIKQRAAAFLNGDIEKDQSLMKGKSAPVVRPFEHASNAFTRLFKRQSKDLEEFRARHQSGTATGGGQLSVDQRPDQHQRTTSLLSATSRSSKVSSSASSKNNRMEYMDMVRAPSERPKNKSAEKSRGRDRTEKIGVGSRMAYGDLVMALPPRDVNATKQSLDVKRPATPSRGSSDYVVARPSEPPRQRSASGARKHDRSKNVSMDLVGPSVARRSVETQRSKRSASPRDGFVRQDSAPAMPAFNRGSLDETRRTTSLTRNIGRGSRELTALPPTIALPQTYQPDVRFPQSMKQKNVPETYRPTGLAPNVPLPAAEDQFPANWPLSQTPSEAGEPVDEAFVNDSEFTPTWARKDFIRKGPIATDAFEEFFVRTLPDSAASQQYIIASSYVSERDFGMQPMQARPRSAPGFRTMDPRFIPERSSSKGAVPPPSLPPMPILRRGELATANLPRPVSIIPEEEPIKNASQTSLADNAAAYFGNQVTQRSRSTPPAQRPSRRYIEPDPELEVIHAVPPAPHRSARRYIEPDPEPEVVHAVPVVAQKAPRPDEILRRASAASIESFSHDAVKSIDIRKRNADVTTPEPQTPLERDSADAGLGSSMKFNDNVEFPSPPQSTPHRRSGSVRSSLSSVQSNPVSQRVDAPQDAAPILKAMPKQRGIPRLRASTGEGSAVASADEFSSPRTPVADNFDRQVSQVLDRVRAPINFKTRPGAETPVARTSIGRTKADRQAKSMTLAPAETSPRKPTPADPEVKLYHLTQAGRSEPIKLYVRLIGESSERVMVRVGGGWADLADYLRQYAEHHGSRTVSEGALELQRAETAGSTSSGGGGGGASGKRTFSGPVLPPEPKSRSPGLPGASKFPTHHTVTSTNYTSTTTSTTTTTDSRFAGGPRTQTHFELGLSRSKPRLWIGDDSGDEEEAEAVASPQDSTPRSAKSGSGSRPSTANNNNNATGGRPHSNSGTFDANSPGLDGRLRSEQLPEQKAKWVEGMIEKAMKSASAAGAGSSAASSPAAGAGVGSVPAGGNAGDNREKYFGEMGRVGGTRRVVFRQASGQETGR